MGLLIGIGIAIFVVWLIVRAAGKGASTYDRIAAGSVRGVALILRSSQSTARGVTMNGRRFLSMAMTLDVELEGRAPYQVSGTFLVPRGVVEPIPGASLEVAVPANNPNNISVLGPGGFTGPWLQTGPPNPY